MAGRTKKKVGILGRGSHGYQSAEEMSRHFDVSLAVLRENLPEVIESLDELEELVESGNLKEVMEADVLICYATHPDVSLLLAENCESGLLIITGERGKTGSAKQIEEIAGRRGLRVLMPEICCVVKSLDEFDWFFEHYGKPEFELEVENGMIAKARVRRCAFCGATRFVAEKLAGVEVGDAPRLAGLYTQLYPCLATRGIEGGIHLAAEMHRIAVERAFKALRALKD